jgi:hypothetical protein
MASVYYNSSISEGAISAASIAANSVTGYAVGGYTGATNKGGKSVASKDDVVKALYRLNPTLKVEFEMRRSSWRR